MNDAEMQGFLDRFKFWENIKVYKDVTTGDLLELLAAVKTKNAAVIRPVVVALAVKAGYAMDAIEINDVVNAVLAKDPAEIVYQVGDYAMKFSVQHLGYKPAGPQDINEPLIRMMAVSAPERTENFTNVQAKQWLADNRGAVKKESRRFIVEKLLRNAPELLDGLQGKPPTVGVDEERLAKIIDIVRTAIPILTAVSAFVPYLIPVVIVLKLIVARYDSNHPVGSIKAVGEPADKGLSLEDLAP